MGLARANTKLLLLGEHSAVYGFPAVGKALEWPLEVKSTPAPDWEFPGLEMAEPMLRSALACLISLASARNWLIPSPCRFQFHSLVPPGSGFGSSGALCAALVKLFWPDQPLVELEQLAWETESVFHGTSSGIDTALALRTGWWSLETSQRPARAQQLPNRELALVVGAVPREANTKVLISRLADRASDSQVKRRLSNLGELSAQTITHWSTDPIEKLASRLNLARENLASLGLETSLMTKVLDASLNHQGSLAAKLSGAGGGGAFLCLYHNLNDAMAGASSLQELFQAGTWTVIPRVI